MAGRPGRKPAKARPKAHRRKPTPLQRGVPREPPVAQERPPASEAAISRPPGTNGREGSRRITVAPQQARPVLLSRAYAQTLGTDVALADTANPGKIMAALNRQAAERNGGRVRLEDVVAHALTCKAANLSGRDGVAAAKELADRTEGPVIQRVQEVSTRFVVSMDPSGVQHGAQAPLSIADWEASVRAADGADERA